MLALAVALVAAVPAAAQPEPDAAPIRLNQLGVTPSGVKRAVFASASPEPLAWTLVDGSGRAVASGRTRPFGRDPYSGERVHQIDFSQFTGSGDGFRLRAAGMESRPFAIEAGIYRRLPFAALAYFYHNRSGTPIEARFVGVRWARPAGHPHERVTCLSGRDNDGNEWPGCPYMLDATGGWYDAGDHGKYVVNGGIAVWTLMNAYERQQLLHRPELFRDGSAALPEAGNGVDDLLDEARWEMEFLLAMQVPDGTRLSLPAGVTRSAPHLRFTEIDASGMVHHKLADEHWTGLPLAPHEDLERRVLFPPSTAATLNLAATAGQCARIWRSIDPAFSRRCLDAAERAWRAAQRNPRIYAIANFPGSGGYDDEELGDEFFWAAAELFVTTGDTDYRRALEASPYFATRVARPPAWPTTETLGTISLALVPNQLPASQIEGARRRLIAAADSALGEAERTGYHVPLAPPAGYTWGSNSDVLNRALILGLAHDWTGERRYLDGVSDGLDYILGRNPLDRSFVTGFGARPMRHPHHRFWHDSADGRYPPPPPGALSGGPNSVAPADDVARALRGTCAPQTCWRDDWRAFSFNEVAINWNAPLVWVAAYMAEH